jgi:hypothetical protein
MECGGDCRQGRDCYCGRVPPEAEDNRLVCLLIVAVVVVTAVAAVTLVVGGLLA